MVISKTIVWRTYNFYEGNSTILDLVPWNNLTTIKLLTNSSNHSNSIVEGGLLVQSYKIRLIPGTSFVIRVLTRANKS